MIAANNNFSTPVHGAASSMSALFAPFTLIRSFRIAVAHLPLRGMLPFSS